MSDTPHTDAEAFTLPGCSDMRPVVDASFARHLERELAGATRGRDRFLTPLREDLEADEDDGRTELQLARLEIVNLKGALKCANETTDRLQKRVEELLTRIEELEDPK